MKAQLLLLFFLSAVAPGLTQMIPDSNGQMGPEGNLVKIESSGSSHAHHFYLSVHMDYSIRKWILDENQRNISYHGTMGYSGSLSNHHFFGAGIQADYRYKRIHVGMGIGWMDYSNEIRTELDIMNGHNTNVVSYKDTYKESSLSSFSHHRLNLSVSAGVKLLNPDFRFNLSPLIRFSQGFGISTKLHSDEQRRLRVYEMHTPWSGVEDLGSYDSLLNYSGIRPRKTNSELFVGGLLSFRVSSRFALFAEGLFPLASSPIMESKDHYHSDVPAFFMKFGLTYKLKALGTEKDKHSLSDPILNRYFVDLVPFAMIADLAGVSNTYGNGLLQVRMGNNWYLHKGKFLGVLRLTWFRTGIHFSYLEDGFGVDRYFLLLFTTKSWIWTSIQNV
jgi:hypothetical protein